MAIRSPWVSLTRLDRPGGTLIDFAPVGSRDWVLEALPEMEGTPTGLELLDDGVRVLGTDITWRLDPELPLLRLEGGSGRLELQGDRRHEPLGAGWYRSEQRLLTDGVVVEDTGGMLVLDRVTRIWVGERSEVHGLFWDSPVSGVCEGDRVEVHLDGQVVAWLEPEFDDVVPAESLLVCTREGFEEGQPVAPGLELELLPGDGGLTFVRGRTREGRDLPVLASNSWGEFAVPPGGAWIPGLETPWVSHGPGWSGAWGEEVVLERLVPEGWLLADLFRQAMPALSSRVEAGDDLMLAAAAGVGFAVQSAPDEIGRPYTTSWFERELRAETGSLAATAELGGLLSWPHSANPRRAAHGAIPWQGLEAVDLLAVARGTERRVTVVEPAWVEGAPPPARWDPLPDLLRVSGPEDAPLVFSLLDADLGLGLVGPATWLPVQPQPLPGVEEVERALLLGRSVASSGPLLVLEADPLLDPSSGPVPVDVRLYAGEGTVRVFVDGEEVEARAMRHLDRFTLEIDGERWAIALLEGPGWAYSAPLSLR